jgi:hypothetical protein
VSDPVDPDDATLWAGRLRPWPAADAPAPPTDGADEHTLLSSRDAEDRTLVRGRRATPPAGEGATSAPPTETAGTAEPPEHVESVAATQLRPDTRRRSPAPPAAPDTRGCARIPDAGARELYRPRAADPVRTPRSPAVPPSSAHAGAPAVVPARRRGRVVVAFGVALVLLVALTIALVVLATLP